MEVTGCRIVKYGKLDAEFSLYDMADLHLGTRGCAKDYIRRDIERIKSDTYSMFFVGGDYADWVMPGDPRFDPEAYSMDIKVNDLAKIAAFLTDELVGLFSPVRQKCLGFLLGNHELKHMSRNSEMFVHEDICKRLRVPNMRYSGWCDVYFVHEPGFRGCRITHSAVPPEDFMSRLRVLVHHGVGAANTAGGKLNKLKNLVDSVEADLIMMGHVHEQFAKSFTRLFPNEDCSKIKSKVTMGLITGSYLRIYGPGYTSYGEQWGYFPTSLGATRARFCPRTRALIVENRADNIGLAGPQLKRTENERKAVNE